MNEEIKKAFPDILKRELAKKRISQSELARMMGVSKPTVSDWIHGEKYPRIDKMQRLADILDIDMDALMGIRSENIEKFNFTLDIEKSALIIAYESAPEMIKECVWRVLGFPRPYMPEKED